MLAPVAAANGANRVNTRSLNIFNGLYRDRFRPKIYSINPVECRFISMAYRDPALRGLPSFYVPLTCLAAHQTGNKSGRAPVNHAKIYHHGVAAPGNGAFTIPAQLCAFRLGGPRAETRGLRGYAPDGRLRLSPRKALAPIRGLYTDGLWREKTGRGLPRLRRGDACGPCRHRKQILVVRQQMGVVAVQSHVLPPWVVSGHGGFVAIPRAPRQRPDPNAAVAGLSNLFL